MIKKINLWHSALRADLADAGTHESKKAILEEAKILLDSLFSGNMTATTIANFLITALEATIKQP